MSGCFWFIKYDEHVVRSVPGFHLFINIEIFDIRFEYMIYWKTLFWAS